MLAGWMGRGLITAIAITVAWTANVNPADASARHSRYGTASNHGSRYPSAYRYVSSIHYGMSRGNRRYARHGYTSLRSWASSGLQCVPFARENSGIELSGNAGTWWDKAEGLYERGAKPEVGSILNFRATGRMRMGHVAVVTNVLDSRHIEIDHANWASPGRVSRDIDVIDVSAANDWTAVRVELDHTNEFGSVYPTHGFIYDRPDGGTMVANIGVTTAPTLNAAPSDLRPASDRIMSPVVATAPEEVAEATDDEDAGGAVRSSRRSYRHHARYGRSTTFAHAKSHAVYAAIPHFSASRAPAYRVSTRATPIATPHHRRRF